MSGLFGGGGSSTTVVNQPAAMTQEEKDLISLQTQLGQKQLDNINALAPFQQQLLESAMADLKRTTALNNAFDSAITPEQQAAAAKSDFERAQRLGPIQDELMQLQLDQLRRNGAATPEQIALIDNATKAGIAAGTTDINNQTKRGIGLIADELANSRGLRLSDSPLSSEAALLARAGSDQIASLTSNLQSAGATAKLNYPLAVQQLQSGINMNQQQVNNAAQQFQADLRNRAYQNRLALTGQASSGGIGLASIGGQPGAALSALASARGSSSTSDTSKSESFGDTLKGIGSAASGIGALATFFSDDRLKTDVEKVGEVRPGIGLYEFRYRGDAVRRRGVMAQEVEKTRPEAVGTHSSGYKFVDYKKVA